MLQCISQELSQTGYPALQSLRLHCDGGAVTLDGEVPSYFLKQIAQDVVQRVPGVEEVVNRIKVTEKGSRHRWAHCDA